MKQHAWLRLIDDFNDGETDFIYNNFENFETFFEVLKKKDLFHLIDPEADSDSEWINNYLIYMYSYDKQSFYSYVSNYLSDIEIRGDKVYFVSRNREDLAELFCDNTRRGSSRDIAEKLLDADGDYFEMYDSTTNDVYNDVIDELNPKNLQRLCELMVFELREINVEPETELLSDIASEQNHPEYVIVDSNNIHRIIEDEKSTNYLLSEHLSDIKSNLYSLHNTSFNGAAESEIWDELWNELSVYFIGTGEFVSKKGYNRDPEKLAEYFEIEIKDFDMEILSYLEGNKNYGNNGTLYYQGNYINVLKETSDCLSLSFPDYPDYRRVDKNINEYFNDYL